MREQLERFIAALRAADQRNDAQFQKLLSEGVELLNLVDQDIAREFSVSRPTVNRWRSGANAPYPFMRRSVYGWLERRAGTMLSRQAAAAPVRAAAGSGGRSDVQYPLAARSGSGR